MTEKVLGFKEKDSIEVFKRNPLEKNTQFRIRKNKLVPVVSVEERDSQVRKACIAGFAEGSKAGKEELAEWLKEWCETNSFFETQILGCSEYKISRINTNDLLKAVRLQVEQKGAKER